MQQGPGTPWHGCFTLRAAPDRTASIGNRNDNVEKTFENRDAALTWARREIDVVVGELLDAGAIDSAVIEARLAWTVPPEVVLGQLREQGNLVEFLWAIGGNVPSDTIHSSAAGSPRDAVRHFALKWQLDASRIDDANAAKSLMEHAEYLYALSDDDRFWS